VVGAGIKSEWRERVRLSSDDDGVEGENMGKQMVCVLTGRPWQFTSEREDTIKIDVRD
jgi:hypothetical protein